MIKLTKAQQDKITGIAIGAVLLMGALWYFGVNSASADLAALRKKSGDMKKKLSDANSLVRRTEDITIALQARNDILTKRESGLAPDRDAYAWLINLINGFIQSRKGMNIDSYSQPSITDAGMLAKFPYKWATFQLRGSGYYEEIGKFFADFENAYPYFIIQNVTLSPNAGPAMEPEKLSVIFDLVAPVAPTENK